MKVIKYILALGALAILGTAAVTRTTSADFDLPGLNQQVQNHEARITNNEKDIKALQDATNTPPATDQTPVPEVTATPVAPQPTPQAAPEVTPPPATDQTPAPGIVRAPVQGPLAPGETPRVSQTETISGIVDIQ